MKAIWVTVAALMLTSCSGDDPGTGTGGGGQGDGGQAGADAFVLDDTGQHGVSDVDAGAGKDSANAADSGFSQDSAATSDASSSGTDTGNVADTGAAQDIGLTIDSGAVDAGGTGTTDTGSGTSTPVGTLYAHTSSTLYKLDLSSKTFALVGKFKFDKSSGSVTDIALDKNGVLYAITFNDVFKCNEANATCDWLAKLPQSFNGLTFVPFGTVNPNDEALIGIANSGTWNHIQIKGNTATIKQLGSYGGGWQSSGDAFSVEKIGTFATVNKGGIGGDTLVQVDPKTGKVLKVIGATNAKALWGFAWWGDVFYGFSSSGVVYAVDEKTGKATPVSGMNVPNGISWWGAGVSTRAAGGILQGG